MPHDPATAPLRLSDEAFDALEALLISDDVPDETMNIEQLDGYLAAILCCPVPIVIERWMPRIWSIEGERGATPAFTRPKTAQTAIRLVRAYYNELLTTLGREEDGWQPFAYALDEGQAPIPDAPQPGQDWIEGFEEGLEAWPPEALEGLDSELSDEIDALLEAIRAPWIDATLPEGVWANPGLDGLSQSGEAANTLFFILQDIGLERPSPLPETP